MKIGNKKIAVAISGGVDSSVAAQILKNQGHELIGIFLHFWKDDKVSDKENKCCSLEALEDARRVCRKIGIPFYTLNFSDIFKKEVVDNFLNEYENGRTPNPCVRCNKYVKLGLLIKKAEELGFPFVATGHYVRLEREIQNLKSEILKNNRNFKQEDLYKLYKAKDENKDQTYFLWTLGQRELKHLIFPLGEYIKPEVRLMAEKFDLPVAKKRESQEICFIPEKNHNDFLKRHVKLFPGVIKLLPHSDYLLNRKDELEEQTELIIGEHQGLSLYTIGQRRGIDIGGAGPFYAVKTDYDRNILYVTDNPDDPRLFSSKFKIINMNWLSGLVPNFPFKCDVVIRYRHKLVKCKITKVENNYEVELESPQRAITPGQSAVFYKKGELLGGGIINLD